MRRRPCSARDRSRAGHDHLEGRDAAPRRVVGTTPTSTASATTAAIAAAPTRRRTTDTLGAAGGCRVTACAHACVLSPATTARQPCVAHHPLDLGMAHDRCRRHHLGAAHVRRVRVHRTVRQGSLPAGLDVPPLVRGAHLAQPAVELPYQRPEGQRPAPPLRGRGEPRELRRHVAHLAPAVGDEVARQGDVVQVSRLSAG